MYLFGEIYRGAGRANQYRSVAPPREAALTFQFYWMWIAFASLHPYNGRNQILNNGNAGIICMFVKMIV